MSEEREGSGDKIPKKKSAKKKAPKKKAPKKKSVTKKTEDREFGDNLVQSLVALPLLDEMAERKAKNPTRPIDVIIDLNLRYSNPGKAKASTSALEMARFRTTNIVKDICAKTPSDSKEKRSRVYAQKSRYAYQHIFACLTVEQIDALAKEIKAIGDFAARPVYKIWLDSEIEGHLLESIRTVKADASLNSFGAHGESITWAVLDSGIDKDHPHFKKYKNLEVEAPLKHMDFTGEETDEDDISENGLEDPNGHGTHVAGIIGGEFDSKWNEESSEAPIEKKATVVYRGRDEQNAEQYWAKEIESIHAVAPRCKLLSLRVLGKDGKGKESNILAALGYVYSMNSSARWPLIHGVNLSVGYEFKAEWYACGQSPLCAEVNRLVCAGTPVVAAAGNTGYGKIRLNDSSSFRTGIPLSINDPGNAAMAITVGSTHRENPHTYGVSYFSSKGPTGDGRVKPDLVAPGERIISCAAGKKGAAVAGHAPSKVCHYREESGTSMAAPHVSGALAAFLSIRREFIGQPDRLKEIILSSCTDLGRERYFQGHGLLDLMRAIQSV